MRRLLIVIILAVIAPAVVIAQTWTTITFEEMDGYVLGDVNGQLTWSHTSNSPTGGNVIALPGGSPAWLGERSLAVYTREEASFGVTNHLNSPLIVTPAGESGSVLKDLAVENPNSHFKATLWVRMPSTPVIPYAYATNPTNQRFAQLNPSSKRPGFPADRYATVRLLNPTRDANGLPRVQMGWYATAAVFQTATVADLEWGRWYRFEYLIHLVDGTDGVNANDVFNLTIYDADGALVGSACGSTWEMGYRTNGWGGDFAPRAINGFDFFSEADDDGTEAFVLDGITMTSYTATGELGVEIAGATTVCAGGTTLLHAMVTGGSGEIAAYEWKDAAGVTVGTEATLLAGAGAYTVAVTDLLCNPIAAVSPPVTVTPLAPLAVTITGGASVSPGGTVTLTANVSGGSGTIMAYEWRDQQGDVVGTGAVLQAGEGTYTVTVLDASCGPATSSAFAVAVAPAIPMTSGLVLGMLSVLIGLAAVWRLR